MESPHSVNSPRRTLSLSKKRRETVSIFDPDDKTSGFGLSGDHGPKPSEVYGFVGSITTVVATDEFSRDPLSLECSLEEDEKPIEPLSDIGGDNITSLVHMSENGTIGKEPQLSYLRI